MKKEAALAILASYRTSRAQLADAVRAAYDHGVTRAEIIRTSGLSGPGVDKILARTERAEPQGDS